ncbi:hypothetical protein [Streptomyces rimosus]|uniref:hypothetical protein n=1 Tax=Streptomyces rimosus TaxID=1927 RepID=UPI00067D1AD9|nr:hypothetical protein [Streptomyces rimosus]
MEADLRREYGVRLRDLYLRDADGHPRLTWRELSTYIQRLPPDSATRTALNDGVPEPSSETLVLADLFDMLAVMDWHQAQANSDPKKRKPKAPKPYPRWWEKKTPRHSPERVARIEDARRRKRERERAITEGRIA